MKLVILVGVAFVMLCMPKGASARTQTKEQDQTQTKAQRDNQTQAQTQGTVQQQSTTQTKLSQHNVRDADGDGFCDQCGNPVGSGKANAQGKTAKKGKHWGPGDGTGNKGVGPQDGTGYGAHSGSQSTPPVWNGQSGGVQGQGGPSLRGGHGPKR